MDSANDFVNVNVDVEDEFEVEAQEVEANAPDTEVESSVLGKRKAKSLTSECWNYFTKKGPMKDGVQMAHCNGCNAKFKSGGKKYGTSSLRRHMKICTGLKYNDVGQMVVDAQGKLKAKKVDQMVAREKCAMAIIKHELPFNFVEYEGIRDWVKYLNPDVMTVSRKTATVNVFNVHLKEMVKLKKLMASIPNRICLTSDLWTSCTTDGYICLTAHFVDTDWKLQSKILNFARMPPPHTGFELSAKVFDFLKEWGIESKIFCLTLDNASANDNFQDTLKNQLRLQNWLLCDGEFFHIRCSAHILNLIVQDGLKVVSGALEKIRESVKYVKGWESRRKKFEECVEQVGGIDTSVSIRQDVPTRWNSTYLMLESALRYRRAFSSLALTDRSYKFCPSEDDWKMGEIICEFLLPFYDMTNLISGTSYPTSNLYFLQVWKIECILKKHTNHEERVIREMAEKMLKKFEKYWDEYSVTLAFGAVLDPRIKLPSLLYCYSKLDSEETANEKVENVKRKLYELFSNYENKSASNSNVVNVSQSHPQPAPKKAKERNDRLFGELKTFNQQRATMTGKSQLDIYLDEPSIDFEYYEDLDVLQWWKDARARFPDLSVMARDILSIPITTVASESAFSIGLRVLQKYRSRILPKNVQALICTRNWLRGFVCNDEDVEDIDGCNSKNEELSKGVSNVGSNVVDLEDD